MLKSAILILITGLSIVQEVVSTQRTWYPCPHGARGRYCRMLRRQQSLNQPRPALQRPLPLPVQSLQHCYVESAAKCFDVGQSFEDPTSCNRCFCTKPPYAGCTQMGCPSPKGCFLEGRFYPAGASFTHPRSCNRCYCGKKGVIMCNQAMCPKPHCEYRSAVYGIGEKWVAADCCNTCHCSGDGRGNAGVMCTQRACD